MVRTCNGSDKGDKIGEVRQDKDKKWTQSSANKRTTNKKSGAGLTKNGKERPRHGKDRHGT